MHWVLQVIGFCPERTKGISEWISGIATRLPIDVATREDAPRINFSGRATPRGATFAPYLLPT
jgi:hypothetical protein